MPNFADRLMSACASKGAPVCVGLDPRYDRLPPEIQRAHADPLEAISSFCMQLLEIVAPLVPAIKPQSAYFEVYQGDGVRLYYDVVARARKLGLIVIGDVKRNDIGTTAEAYAAGHLASDGADAITVNGYLGDDGITPFLEPCRDQGKGVFVLVRTSNPSAPQLQDQAGPGGKKLFVRLAELVAKLGSEGELVGQTGFSAVGAVVGATYPDEARLLRRVMGRQIFLVPGYGAQGASAADCAAAFDADGRGAIVNASRSVIYAHADQPGSDWKQAVHAACKTFADDIAAAVRP